MKGDRLPQANNYLKKHKRLSVWHKAVLSMAAIVVFITTYMLILPAITMESKLECGITEHIHTEACHKSVKVLSCGLTEDEQSGDNVTSGEAITGHIHTDECYTVDDTLVCDMEEHTHTEACYVKQINDSSESVEAVEVEKNISDDITSYGDLSEFVVSVDSIKVADADSTESVFESAVETDEKLALTMYALTGDRLKGVLAIPDELVNKKSAVYDEDTNTFSTELQIQFAPTKSEIEEHNLVFAYKLPAEIVGFADIKFDVKMLNDTTDDSTQKFYYYFHQDDDGTNYIIVEFIEDYVKDVLSDEDTLRDGYIKFNCELSSDAATDEGGIHLEFDGGVDLNLGEDEVYYPSGTNAKYDVSTEKNGSYNKKDNSLTYTVEVYSRKGTTDTISLEDVMPSLNGLTIEDYEITVNKAVKSVTRTNNGNWDISKSIEKGEEVTPSSCNVDKETGKITLELDALNKSEVLDSTDNYSYVENYDAYLITYTYKLADMDSVVNVSVENDVSVTLKGSTPSVTAEAEKSVTVNNKPDSKLKKTGVNNNDGTITWTLTIGDGNTSIEAGELTDTMFSKITKDDINVSMSDGYTINVDDDGYVTGITFNEGIESTSCTVTYSTPVSGWGSFYVSNSASYNGETASGSVGVTFGSVSKSNGSLVEDKDGILTIMWDATFTIPSAGIPEGTVVKDYVDTSKTEHYISADNAKAIREAVLNAFAGSVSEPVFTTSDGTSYSYSEITSDMKFVSYSYTFVKAIEGNDDYNYTMGYSYPTTIDTSEVINDTTYTNYLQVGGFSEWNPAQGSYDYKKKVVKLDGNGNIGTNGVTDTSSDDGTVVWKVKIDASDCYSVQVTDTLPGNVTLEELAIAAYSDKDSGYKTLELNNSVSLDAYEANYWDSGNNLIGTSISTANGEMLPSPIYLRYTCKVDESLIKEGVKNEIAGLENNVSVSMNGKIYTAKQTQNLEVDKRDKDKAKVEKTYGWDQDTKTITYSVVLNPNAETYNDGVSYDFVDTLSYRDGTGYDSSSYASRQFELDYTSVMLYYAKEETYVDDDGVTQTRLVKGDPVLNTTDNKKWSYSYSESTTASYQSNYVKKIITATFPDNTPLIFEYQYKVNMKAAGTDTSVGADNSAEIKGSIVTEKTSTKVEEQWQNSSSSGNINKEKVYKIFKVDKNDYSMRLQGAVFKLYAYSSDEGSYIDTKKTFTTGEDGIAEVNFDTENLDKGTLYYLVEVEPPNGYKLPDNPKRLYFYVNSDDGTNANIPKPLPSDCVNLAVESPTEKIENEVVDTTSISVEKRWLAADGSVIVPGESSIEVGLYRRYKLRKDTSGDSLVDVTADISTTYGGTISAESSLLVGSKAKLIVKYTNGWFWNPNISFNINGNTIKGSWDSNATCTVEFDVTGKTEITGTLDSTSTSGFVVSIEAVDDEEDGEFIDDGAPIKTYKVTSDEGWSRTIDNLPVSGNVGDSYADFEYYVREITQLDDYKTEHTDTSSGVVITNTKRERKSISVIKQWLDKAGNAIEKATGSINVKLCRKAVENKTVLITPQIIETSQLTDKSSTNRFAVGSRVKLLVYVGFNTSSWQPDISIQGATEVTSESGWNIDGTGIYTYVFDVDSSTKSITGTVTSRYYSDAYVELVLVSGPESTDDAEVLAVDTIGEYTITADEDWSKSIDITNLDSTGVYKKSDGTVADVSYIYYIEEADVNGYSVTYDGESSPTEFDVEKISDGCSTTIVNKATGESVTLPSTGGTGTKVYTIGGALMMICAACCLYIKNKKSKGESLI